MWAICKLPLIFLLRARACCFCGSANFIVRSSHQRCFLKNGVLKRPVALLKRLQHSRFPVKFAKFLRKSFLKYIANNWFYIVNSTNCTSVCSFLDILLISFIVNFECIQFNIRPVYSCKFLY